MKNAVKKINVNKLRKFNIKLCIMLGTIAMALCNTMTAFAASAGKNSENTKPTNIGGASTMNTAVSIVFWVIRVAIILSVNICGYILTEVSKLLTSMSDSMKANEFMMIPDVQIVASAKSKLWILGPFVDLFISGIMMLPVIIIGLVAIICAGTIVIKLIFRSFELAMLMVVSPAFFACASADVTKPYFKNFIINFIRCAFQIIFMAVVWVVVVQWQINKTTFGTYADLGSYIWNMVPNLFTMIAMTIIMIKPPKVLTSLIR